MRAGFVPLSDYAALGDGRTVALLARDGSIDWLALPTVDAPPVFARLLDPERGGFLCLAPAGESVSERRYLRDTNVVETLFSTGDGVVRVTQSLNTGDAGRLPWTELALRVEGVRGEVAMEWTVNPGDRFRAHQPWARMSGDTPLITVGDQMLGLVSEDVGSPCSDGHRLSGCFRTAPGSRHLLCLVATDSEPVALPAAQAIEERLDATVAAWRRWSAGIDNDGPWAEAVARSALALKLLIHAPSGAIAASATTSLPERVGGDRNFDYRYAWVRDMSFSIEALMNLGALEEVHASISWLLAAVKRSAPELYVFYSLSGDPPGAEAQIAYRGYLDSQPVQSGNQAAHQRQLGSWGDLLDAIWRYVEDGNHLDSSSAELLAWCADRVCDLWRSKDSGIWELEQLEHYTSSKLGCWMALDRATRLAEAGQLPSRNMARWGLERDCLRDWISRYCWSDQRNAYCFHAGTDELDAAVLLMGRTGFDRGDRLKSTIRAIGEELRDGPLLYRYSGMQDRENAFLVCSFWLVEALAYVGSTDEACSVMEELVDLANDAGLYSEEMDPRDKALLGNFPLALTHLGLINAAATLQRLGRNPSASLSGPGEGTGRGIGR